VRNIADTSPCDRAKGGAGYPVPPFVIENPPEKSGYTDFPAGYELG